MILTNCLLCAILFLNILNFIVLEGMPKKEHVKDIRDDIQDILYRVTMIDINLKHSSNQNKLKL